MASSAQLVRNKAGKSAHQRTQSSDEPEQNWGSVPATAGEGVGGMFVKEYRN